MKTWSAQGKRRVSALIIGGAFAAAAPGCAATPGSHGDASGVGGAGGVNGAGGASGAGTASGGGKGSSSGTTVSAGAGGASGTGTAGTTSAASGTSTASGNGTSSGTSTSSGAGGAGSGAGGAGNGGMSAAASSSSSGGPCPPCSADQKSVVDCAGNVIQACAAGQLCSQGTCIDDPCAAAKMGNSTYGCEYWALNLDNILPGACYAAYVTNTWTAPVKIHVDYAGNALQAATFTRLPVGQGQQLTYAPYDDAKGLAPGNVAILFLAQTPQFPAPLGEACPQGITPAITVDPAVHGTGIGNAFHITTNGPVVAYQIFPYGGGSAAITSASLLLPTSAWDVNYIAVEAFAKTQIASNWGLPSLDILAGTDNTHVTISPVAAIAGGNGVAASPMGQPVTYTINKGQYVQFSQGDELTGSAILADQPIAVFGGNSCMNVPADVDACDTGGQQIPPIHALGSEYAAVRYRGRGGIDESVPWRLVGAVDGTQLTYTPSTPPGAPTSLLKGQLAQFDAPGPFLVASQDVDHPFYISAHMTGGSAFNGEGDAEFVNIVPTAQYLSSYVFFTDPTYPETNLVLVRAQGPNGFEDVKLDCSGVVTGWTPLGAYEYARVDLVTGNFKSVGGCSNGAHFIESTAPFATTVWGWGSLATFPFSSQYVSYAYPAGAGVKPLTGTVVNPTHL